MKVIEIENEVWERMLDDVESGKSPSEIISRALDAEERLEHLFDGGSETVN